MSFTSIVIPNLQVPLDGKTPSEVRMEVVQEQMEREAQSQANSSTGDEEQATETNGNNSPQPNE